MDLNGMENVYALSCGTDGSDGTENNAGALITSDTPKRAADRGVKAAKLLANNDSYSLFEALNDLVVTGPTRTNVNDISVILVL